MEGKMNQQGRTIRAQWNLIYDHSIGPTASHFFDEIVENEKILGKLCKGCGRVLVPPRSFCDRCYVETKDWVEVKKEGTIEAFTIIYQQFKGLPEPPYALAYVLLEGADTAMAGMVKGVHLSDPKIATSKLYIGARVKVIFSKERRGSVLDFWYELV
jgi:uncharacterized OB-fold protein